MARLGYFSHSQSKNKWEKSMKILARTFLCLCVLLGGGGESPAASAPAKIVLAYASMVARTSFIWIAKDQGFFAKYGC
jgi:hypothetical protein